MYYSITSNETYLVQGVNEAYSFCGRGKIKESAEQRTAGVGVCVCLAEAEKIACITKKTIERSESGLAEQKTLKKQRVYLTKSSVQKSKQHNNQN